MTPSFADARLALYLIQWMPGPACPQGIYLAMLYFALGWNEAMRTRRIYSLN